MLRYFTDTISSRPLGLARIGVGAAATIRGLVAIPILWKLAQPETLLLPYVDWTPNPSEGLVIILLVTWITAGLLFTFGWKVPVTGPILLAALVGTLLLDQQLYANHLYLMTWLIFLLILADSGSSLAVGEQHRKVVRWPVLLIMAQISIVYVFTAITKMNSEFMSGSVLASVLGGGVIPFPDSLRTPGLLSLVAASAVFVELFVGIFLWSLRLRVVAAVLGVVLHLSITLLMTPTSELFVFTLEMLAIYPLFLTRDPLYRSSSHSTEPRSVRTSA